MSVAESVDREEAPPEPDQALPGQPQSSIHAQTMGPEAAEGAGSSEPAERTLAEEAHRHAHGGSERP